MIQDQQYDQQSEQVTNKNKNLTSMLSFSTEKQQFSLEDFIENKCQAKEIQSPRSVEAMTRLGIRHSDISKRRREEIMAKDRLQLMKMTENDEKEYYIKSKLQKLESFRQEILQNLLQERKKVSQDLQDIDILALDDQKEKKGSIHSHETAKLLKKRSQIMSIQLVKQSKTNLNQSFDQTAMESIYGNTSKMFEKESIMLEKLKLKRQKELEDLMESQMKLQEMKTRELQRIQKMNEEQLKNVQEKEAKSLLNQQRIQEIEQRKKEYEEEEKRLHEEYLKRFEDSERHIMEKKELFKSQYQNIKEERERQRKIKLEMVQAKKEELFNERKQILDKKLEEIEQKQKAVKEQMEQEKLKKQQQQQMIMSMHQEKLEQIKGIQSSETAAKQNELEYKEQKANQILKQLEDQRKVTIDFRHQLEQQKAQDRIKMMEQQQNEFEERQKQLEKEAEEFENQRKFNQQKRDQENAEKRKQNLLQNEKKKEQLQKIEEEIEEKKVIVEQQFIGKIQIVEEKKKMHLKEKKFKLIEETIKLDMHRQNYERLQEIQQNKNQLMMRKIEQDKERVSLIEKFKQNKIFEKHHIRQKFLQQRDEIEKSYEEKLKKAKKSDNKVNFSFDQTLDNSNKQTVQENNFLSPKQNDSQSNQQEVTRESINNNPSNNNYSARSSSLRTKRIVSKSGIKAGGDTVNLQINNLKDNDLDLDLRETLPLILEGLANHKYFADFYQNQQNHTQQFYLQLCQIETNIEDVQKPQIKQIFNQLTEFDNKQFMTRKVHNHLKIFNL